MRLLTTLLLIAYLATLPAQNTCLTPPVIHPLPAGAMNPPDPNIDYCVDVRIEVAYDIYQDKGSTTQAYVDDLLAQVAAIYSADDIAINFDVHIWQTPDPYVGSSSGQLLNSFGNNMLPHDADVAQLISYRASGGIAWVDVLCHNNLGHSFSSIQSGYNPYPVYSWSVMVIAHELGHNFGSPHTHACVWNGNNTAIDGCAGATEGNCPNPGSPANGGTVMSYCHFTTGIDFNQGFGPQPLALMKNRISGALCIECEDNPPPPPADCEENEVIVEIMPDAYPMEVTYRLETAAGNVLASGGPWPKNERWVIQTDSLCLEDGCYKFVIVDPDGFAGQPGGDGAWYLNNGINTLGSGIAFTDSVEVDFCLGAGDGCNDVVWNSLSSYGNQDYSGGMAEITEAGNKLHLAGNTWKVMPLAYEVTPNTVISLDLKIVNEGEIHGLAFVPNPAGIHPTHTLRLAGTQLWGNGSFDDDIVSTGYRHYDLPIGQQYQQLGLLGNYEYLGIINDHDLQPRNAEAYWKNVTICEGNPGDLPASMAVRIGTAAEFEELLTGENSQIYGNTTYAYPNPANDTIYLPFEAQYQVYPLLGQRVLKGYGNKIDVSSLKPGMYGIVYGGRFERIIVQ